MQHNFCNHCGNPLQENICFSCGQTASGQQTPENDLWQFPDDKQQNQQQPWHNFHSPNTAQNHQAVRPPSWLKIIAMMLPVLSWIINIVSTMLFMQNLGTNSLRMGIDIASILIAASGIIVIIILLRKYPRQRMYGFLAIAIFALIVAIGNTVIEATW